MEHKTTPDPEDRIDNILHPIVKEWFYSKFKSFSLPQRFGVSEIHARQNILVSAPTGATKTLTAFLSILNELVDSAEKGILEDKIYCIYISPLKALNYDIEVNLKEPLKEMEEIAGKELGIRIATRTGDTTSYEKSKMLHNPPHILITTPESLGIVLSSIKFSNLLRDVDWCIVDEVHALAENKRGVHLSLSLERLQRLSKRICRVGLSATVAPLEEVAKLLVGYEGEELRPCKIVDVQFLKETDMKVLCPVPNLIDVSHQELHTAMYEMIDKLIQKHKTTLIFTNTRAATERVVDYLRNKFPDNYSENIGAHHGSLGKSHRLSVEKKLRNGELKAVVCSTSLELGIDIGYIDLVILLSSPKSVARALQRIGRSGHKLHDTTKGRIIVLNRDDLVECSVLLKNGLEHKIDKLHIPRNCLDVLSQHIYGIAIETKIHEDKLLRLVRKSYCYHELSYKVFQDILDYLSGEYASLEDRHVYAKIWHDQENGMIGRRGRLARVIYMTNIGTIPDQARVQVKMGDQILGTIDEGFLERLKKGDVFVLGGSTYEFNYSNGMTIQVNSSSFRPPTVPSWVSEMLPLSFDLACDIGRFRRLMEDKLAHQMTKDEVMQFIKEYLFVDENAANSMYQYFYEQFKFAEIPHDRKLLIEHYKSNRGNYYIFHSLFGRRVNDCLSRAFGLIISRQIKDDVEIGINDNGFYLRTEKSANISRALDLIESDKLELLMKVAIKKSEVLKRRFRHCAMRSLMILRNYKGRRKNVGKQQISSKILLSAVRRIDQEFPILREARREVLEDLMDIKNAERVIKMIEDDDIQVTHFHTRIASPFSFNLVTQGRADIMKMEDRMDFLKKMHKLVLAKISLKEGKK